jgi:catechol 2,3-dioxygenase-like lactoylglutathione lyase family enzyme
VTAARVHHSAICVRDLQESLRFYADGLGLEVLMDHRFAGDWPTLFGVGDTELRSVFLGDPRNQDAGIVELVVFGGTSATTSAAVPAHGAGFFLLSFYVAVEEVLGRLRALGVEAEGRIDQPAPGGSVTMVTVRDPDGVLVELIDVGDAAASERRPAQAPKDADRAP